MPISWSQLLTGNTGGAGAGGAINPNLLTAWNSNIPIVTVTNNNYSYDYSSSTSNLTLNGTSADETIIGGAGNDSLSGGAGNDLLDGLAGHDTLVGGDGNDILLGYTGNDSLNGGAGNDTLEGEAGNDILLGGAGNDTFNISDGGTDTILDFGNGADTITGTASAGQQLNIYIDNSSTTPLDLSTLLATYGVASVTGGSGNDTITGGAGNDTLLGGEGNDEIFGEKGNNLIVGGAGNDLLSTDLGQDTLDGGAGNDTLFGGAGNDSLVGGSDNDRLDGGTDNDTMVGGTGSDIIFAGSGSDTIYLGNQTTDYSAAMDGTADFVIYYAMDSGVDTIYGFEAGTGGSDVIQFYAGLLKTVDGTTQVPSAFTTYILEINSGVFSDTSYFSDSRILMYELNAGDGSGFSANDVTAVLNLIFGASNATARATGIDGLQTAQYLFIIDNGTDSYLWYFDSNDTKASTDDLILIGVVKNVTNFADGDMAIIIPT